MWVRPIRRMTCPAPRRGRPETRFAWNGEVSGLSGKGRGAEKAAQLPSQGRPGGRFRTKAAPRSCNRRSAPRVQHAANLNFWGIAGDFWVPHEARCAQEQD